ncbi:MAG: hypothetical protein ACXW39_03855 [Nitrospira sp.]
MKTGLLSLFAGAALMGGVAVAQAGEPITLESSQLDKVTAGVRNITENGVGSIRDNNVVDRSAVNTNRNRQNGNNNQGSINGGIVN